ncbi:MAG: globin [Planctomycetales bacterium]|nr:globin [Planctomycetales bacterium]
MLTPRDLFLDSLERCAADEGFLPTFYRRFLASSREVRDKFRHTDFEQQNEMLLNSLRLVAAATAGAQRGLSELKERAKTHDRHHLNIRPQLYEFWRVAIVLTASEFDPLWSDTTEDAWNRILGTVIDHMVRHY